MKRFIELVEKASKWGLILTAFVTAVNLFKDELKAIHLDEKPTAPQPPLEPTA